MNNYVFYYGHRYEGIDIQYIYRYNNIGKRISDKYGTFFKARRLSKEGFILQEEQFDTNGNIIHQGSYTTIQYKYSDVGLITEEIFLEKLNSFDYKKATNEYGIHKVLNKYDKNGMLIEMSYFSEFEEPVADQTGLWKILYQYNEYLQRFIVTMYGVDGKEVEISGYSKEKYIYDDNGNLIRVKKYMINNQEYIQVIEEE